jgi:D-glycero-D-manno-heptose 1,7-bisphosphate phosphatase
MADEEPAVLPNPDKTWTLFLDRDGVINRKIEHDYVRSPSMLHIPSGVPQALVRLRSIFGRIILITNQRGIGRGLMSEIDLEAVHAHMISIIESERTTNRKENAAEEPIFDAIYHCPHDLDRHCGCRKPAPGMVRDAMKRFPDIRLDRSIMVGDSASDIELGERLRMFTVHVTKPGTVRLGDLATSSIIQLASWFEGISPPRNVVKRSID